MSTGEGLFYGLASLALVWLYAATKDRWRWRTIAKRLGLAVAAVFTIGAGWTYVQRHLESLTCPVSPRH